jgi:hypothetical protein
MHSQLTRFTFQASASGGDVSRTGKRGASLNADCKGLRLDGPLQRMLWRVEEGNGETSVFDVNVTTSTRSSSAALNVYPEGVDHPEEALSVAL